MQEETEQRFIFRGRWRGRRLWILACAAVLAAGLVLLMVLVIPSSRNNDEKAAAAEQDITQPAAGEEAEAGQQAPDSGQQQNGSPGQGGGESPAITPGDAGQSPGIVVDFPDPTSQSPEAPPDGYGDIYGHWVLDMSGSAYGLTNCHIFLEDNGTVSSPPDYVQVFEIATSSYSWEEGNPSFSASLQVMLKMASSQVLIPVEIELVGTVDGAFVEINGDFTAEPQGEPYAPYAQQGTFVMHR